MSGTTEAQKDALIALYNNIWNDPEIGESVRRKSKHYNPAITIPDDNPVAQSVRGELAKEREARVALEAQIAADRAEREQARAETQLRAALGKAQGRFNLTDDGMAGTIKLMQERQISDPEAAAALYVDGLPKVKPSAASSVLPQRKLNMFGTQAKDEAWATLHTDPDQYFQDVVNEVFREMPVGQ